MNVMNTMKKRATALLAAAALCISLAGCTISTPASVGTIGDLEVSSGLYLLSQYQAYYSAQTAASNQPAQTDAAGDTAADSAASSSASSEAAASSTAAVDYSAMSAKTFLQQTIQVTDEDTGEVTEWLVSDYVASETLRNLQYYAAVRTRFAQLGGQLTDEEIAQADDTAQEIWDANEELYSKNGFGLSTIKEYEYTLTMADKLLQLVYGVDGEQPVSDAELTSYVENEMLFGYYTTVPLYNTSTYAIDTDVAAEAKGYCDSAIDLYNSLREQGATEDTTLSESGVIYANFYTALGQYLPSAYAACENEFADGDLSVSSTFFTESMMESYFGEDAAAQLRTCAVGDAVCVEYGMYTALLFVRANALDENELDDVRENALQDMKGEVLMDELFAYGAQLPSSLSESAMKALPASKVLLSLPSES